MHGIHIAKDIIGKAKEQGKVKKATIELGEIANITKEDLAKQLCNAADFEFEIIEKKAYVRCACGYEGTPEIVERQHDVVIFSCPACGLNPEVVEGDKVVLKCVEVE
jgi:Zn finger protein HypA/HybF involved in hydrogenase expression